MSISMPRGQMNIRKTDPQLSISSQIPRFRIPRERLRSELGLAGPLSFAKEFRNKGKSEALRAIATYASDGDFLTNVNIPGDKSIPMLTQNKMRRFFQKPETNIGLIPSSPPSLDWDKGHIDVNFSRHSVSVDWSGSNLANINVDTGYPVQVSLSRRHQVNVSPGGPAVTKNTYSRYIDRSV